MRQQVLKFHQCWLILFLIIITTAYGDALENAKTQFKEKNYKEAIKSFQTVIKQSTNYEPAWFGLQNSYIQSGDLESARKLINISLSDRLLWGNIRVLFYSNQFDTIPQLIFELTRKYPKSEYINDALDLGIILAYGKDDSISLTKYAEAFFGYEINQYDDGINATRELIVKSNILAEYGYLLLGQLFLAKNEINQAIATLNEFSNKFQSSKLRSKVRYQVGLIYLESLNDTIIAKDIFEDLISDFPASPESYFARSRLSLLESESKIK